MAFFLQLHFMLISQHFYGLFYHLIFRDISLNSQETFILSSVMFQLIFRGFLFILTFSWAVFLSYPVCIRLFIRIFILVSYSDIIIHLFIRILIGLVFYLTFLSCLAIRYFFIIYSLFLCLSFELFSCLIYLFISCYLFLLNCANSVLCAV